MTERFLTLHPDPGKQGVNINRARYEVVREAITASIQEHGTITFKVLTKEIGRRLAGKFSGSVTWYVTTVKLDLEARGIIARVPGSRPQQLVLAQPSSPLAEDNSGLD